MKSDNGSAFAGDKNEAFLKSLKLDEYDDEDEGAHVFLGGEHLATYQTNLDDPLLRNQDDLGDDDSDVEDVEVRAEDAVLLVGRSDEVSSALHECLYFFAWMDMYMDVCVCICVCVISCGTLASLFCQCISFSFAVSV
jgi:hypothetical protein